MTLIEWLWSLLPDTCEVSDCCRKGVRGNENRIYPFPNDSDFYIVMCDYCSSRYHHGDVLRVDGLLDLIVSKESKVVDLVRRRKEIRLEQ